MVQRFDDRIRQNSGELVRHVMDREARALVHGPPYREMDTVEIR
jgi:hypothetical protein